MMKEWIVRNDGRCYLCGRSYYHWMFNLREKPIGVRLRKSNHLTQPVVICTVCLRRCVHINNELEKLEIKEKDSYTE